MGKSTLLRMAGVTGIVILALNIGSVQSTFSASMDPDHDWKFNVPVELNSILAAEGSVLCSVGGDDGIIGQGEESFTIGSDGSFSSTVTVFVTVNEGENPFDANDYVCRLKLKSTDTETFFNAQSYDSEYRADDLSIKAREDAEFVGAVTGDLPAP